MLYIKYDHQGNDSLCSGVMSIENIGFQCNPSEIISHTSIT